MEKQHLLSDMEIRFYKDADFNFNLGVCEEQLLEDVGKIPLESLSKFEPNQLEFEEWFSFN